MEGVVVVMGVAVWWREGWWGRVFAKYVEYVPLGVWIVSHWVCEWVLECDIGCVECVHWVCVVCTIGCRSMYRPRSSMRKLVKKLRLQAL